MTAPDYVPTAPTGWWVKKPFRYGQIGATAAKAVAAFSGVVLRHFTDTFTRGDSTTSIGPDWSSTNMGIATNAAYTVADDSDGVASFGLHPNTDNQKVTLTVGWIQGTGGRIYALLGYNDAGEGAYASFSPSGTWYIYSATAGLGGTTQRAAATSQGFTSADTVDLRRSGNLYSLHKNDGAPLASWTDSGDVVPRDSNHRNVGIGGHRDGSGNRTHIETFECDDLP